MLTMSATTLMWTLVIIGGLNALSIVARIVCRDWRGFHPAYAALAILGMWAAIVLQTN